MANITFPDGTSADFTQEELVIWLKATNQYVEPKSDAQKAWEAMAEFRAQERAVAEFKDDLDEAEVPIIPPAPEPTIAQRLAKAVVEDEIDDHAAAIAEAKATGKPVEGDGYIVMPGGKVLPRHVVNPGGKPPNQKLRIPFTAVEFQVMNALKRSGRNVKTAEVAAMLGWTAPRVSTIISKIHNQGRGIGHGAHSTWFLHPWALRAEWFQSARLTTHWPPKNGASTP